MSTPGARGGAPRTAPVGWLLLIHQLPAEPAYLRVKVLRRLKGIGAVALKNSVYLLPDREDCREDFQWVIREIVDGGGSATLSVAEFLEGTSDGELQELFNGERDREYAEVAASADRLLDSGSTRADADRLTRSFQEIHERDHFRAAGREPAARAIARVAAAVEARRPAKSTEREGMPLGAIWVTRTGVFVDRMASAWLIRRFIDPAARFRFVPSTGYALLEGEIAFDMFEGGYSHEADRCTFETLVARFGLTDPALGPVAEIVHDIDCKDGKFGRPETAGVAIMLRGIAAAHERDKDRIEAAGRVFENLLEGFRTTEVTTKEEP